MKITICGLAGTGTSTVGRQLAAELDYEFVSTGDIFRSKARDLGMSLNEFEELCKTDEQYDKALDADIEKLGRTKDDLVVESRLAWYFIPDSFKVKFECNDEVRTDRIAERDGISREDAHRQTGEREEYIRDRYRRYYGIECFDDPAHFDCVIDTTEIRPPEIVARIREAAEV